MVSGLAFYEHIYWRSGTRNWTLGDGAYLFLRFRGSRPLMHVKMLQVMSSAL